MPGGVPCTSATPCGPEPEPPEPTIPIYQCTQTEHLTQAQKVLCEEACNLYGDAVDAVLPGDLPGDIRKMCKKIACDPTTDCEWKLPDSTPDSIINDDDNKVYPDELLAPPPPPSQEGGEQQQQGSGPADSIINDLNKKIYPDELLQPP